MQALDTNVLVYAEIVTSPQHARARELVVRLAQGIAPWALPWPCVYEFLRIVTHPRIYHPPMPVDVALGDLRALLASPSLILLSETDRHAEVLQSVISASGVTGNLMHDAHIAALCIEHGITEIITGDRDFLRFDGIQVTNPFA